MPAAARRRRPPGRRRHRPGRAADRPADPRLMDRFGRVATDLRVSLTDRCNLRCTYCMPPEGLDWMPDERLLTDDETDPADHDRGRTARRRGGPVHRRRTAAAQGPGADPRRDDGPADGVRRRAADRPDDERARPGPPRRRAGGGRAAPDQRLARQPRPGPVRPDHPPRPAGRRPGRAARRRRGRPDPGEGQHGAAARRQRRRGRPAACAGPSSTATSCASSSRCRWTRTAPGTARRWSPPRRSSAQLRTAFRLEPADPGTRGAAPAETWLVDGGGAGRPGHGRDRRLGHPAVLRRLRPHPAHRRRPGPQLPVRPRRDRSARPAAGRCRTTTRSPTPGAAPCGPRRPVTGSTTRPSCSRPADERDRRVT